MVKENEPVYDEKIAPLMQQIIDICSEHELPFFAVFEYNPNEFCVSSNFKAKESPTLEALYQTWQRNRPSVEQIVLTTITKPN